MDLEMQVRAGAVAGGADNSERLADGGLFADGD
jgi:hypothetical protein